MIFYIARFLVSLPYYIGLHPRIRGWKRLHFKGPAILVSNHWSIADPVFIALLCLRPVYYMAKVELFEKPVGAFFMRGLKTLPVEKGDAASLSSVRAAAGLLEKGKIFGIFPEGHRAVLDEMDDMSRGAAFLAARCKVPVIPVYSDPATLRHMHSRMNIGEPILVEDAVRTYGGKPVNAVNQAITDSLQRLRWEQEGIRR